MSIKSQHNSGVTDVLSIASSNAILYTTHTCLTRLTNLLEHNKKARSRLNHSRRNTRYCKTDFRLVEALLQLDWSPDQIVGHLKFRGHPAMSHELIYQYIWSDKTEGGALRLSLVISYLPQYFPILCSKLTPRYVVNNAPTSLNKTTLITALKFATKTAER